MNIKKLDEKDVIFIDQPWTDEDRMQFSAFLKKRKIKTEIKQQFIRKRRAGSTKKTA